MDYFTQLKSMIGVFIALVGAYYSIVKLNSAINKKKSNNNVERSRIFPNGDKEEIIREIQKLHQNFIDNNQEHLEIRSDIASISRRLGPLFERLGKD